MPSPASAIESSSYLRLLVLGGPKIGKTTTIIYTCEKPAYVINCDDQFSLKPAARCTSEFEWDLVVEPNIFQKMESAIKSARDGVKEGKYKTIVWDTMSMYSDRILQIILASTDTGKGPDGRRAYPDYERTMRNILDRLFTCKAHVIVNAHYIDVKGASIDGQLEKSGDGIVPLLAGKARATVPALFQDVVFLDKRNGERVFVTSDSGVWGPGCRNLAGVDCLPADISLLWEKMQNKKPVTKEKKSK